MLGAEVIVLTGISYYSSSSSFDFFKNAILTVVLYDVNAVYWHICTHFSKSQFFQVSDVQIQIYICLCQMTVKS